MSGNEIPDLTSTEFDIEPTPERWFMGEGETGYIAQYKAFLQHVHDRLTQVDKLNREGAQADLKAGLIGEEDIVPEDTLDAVLIITNKLRRIIESM